jgi:DNA-binding phage protein
MNKKIKLDSEIEELLKNTRTTEEILASLEDLEPLDLDKDPEYVADFMKGMLIEDILKAMEDNKISKVKLAKKLGKSRQYVTRILNETANFTLKSIAEIACALDMQAQARIYAQDEVLNISKKTFQIEFKNFNFEKEFKDIDDSEYISSTCYKRSFTFVPLKKAV